MASQLFAVDLDLAKNQLLNAVAHNLAAPPSSPVGGQIYYDTATDKLYWYNDNSTSWVAAEGSAPVLDWAEDADIADVTKAAESAGVLNEVARGDHKHDVSTAIVGSSAPGDAAAEGAATSLARSNHVHGREAYATNTELNTVDAAAEAAGSSPTVARGDHKHAATSAVPSGSAPGDTQLGGSATTLSLSDHRHAREAYATVTELADVTAAAENAGASATIARGDHKHNITSAAPGASAVADTQSAGSATTVSLSDHRHAREAFANVVAQTSFGSSSNNGAATTLARSDHVHGTPTHVAADHSSIALSSLSAATATVSMGGFAITNLLGPTAGTDAANKDYVDGVAQGLDVKQSVRAATTANGTLASAFQNAAVIDGITLATNDRILIKNQSSAQENGIYTVNASGAPTRALDMNAWTEVPGAFVFVEVGTANADTGWVATADAGGTLNTTAIPWAQFSGAGAYIAGAGIGLTGNTFAITAGTGIAVGTDDVAVLRTDANGRVPIRYSANYGDGAATSYNIDHNLNSLSVITQVFRVSDGKQVEVDVTQSTVNRVILVHNTAPASNAYRVVVLG